MSQLDLKFDARNAQETLRDIIAMLAPEEAGGVSDLIQDSFKSPHHALGSGLSELGDITGIRTARFLKLVDRLVRLMATEKIMETREVLSSWTALTSYLRVLLCGVQIEKFLCLYLDKKNRLIRIVENTGTVDRCPVYPREVIRNAILLNATAIILVHNHPSGDPSPSQSDIDMTRKIVDSATTLNIRVHDHCIVGDNEIVSFKTLGLM